MFKQGVTVKLKSGGPLMTVVDVSNPEKILCAWHRADGFVQTHEFPPLCLKASKTQ